MPNSTATPQSVQARAAAALTQLLTENPSAPMLTWYVYPTPYTPDLAQLAGQAGSRDDSDARSAVAAWAKILDTDVVETHKGDRDGGWTDVRASSDAGGVVIEVWAMCDEAPAVAA